eukprot:3637461-Ditylum_brightwellii.AAC.1
MDFFNEGIVSKATPQPQLLVKDHKDKEENGDYPTHLVIPATHSMATFSKIGYLGIKRVLDDNKINYVTFAIIQASDLKEKLEMLNLRRDEVTLMSLDIKNMYPSVQLRLIWKLQKCYVRNLPEEDRRTIEACLEMIKLGMCSTLIQYHGKYYVYKGVVKGKTMEDEGIVLAIGAYESAFCADIIASYVFEMTEMSFLQGRHRGIYCNNGLVIFIGKQTRMQIVLWLSQYQTLVNKIAEGDYLQFTTEVWSPMEPNNNTTSNNNNKRQAHSLMEKWLKRVKLCKKNAFPFLDMKMVWDAQ